MPNVSHGPKLNYDHLTRWSAEPITEPRKRPLICDQNLDLASFANGANADQHGMDRASDPEIGEQAERSPRMRQRGVTHVEIRREREERQWSDPSFSQSCFSLTYHLFCCHDAILKPAT